MGRRGGWLYAVKKVVSCSSGLNKDKKKRKSGKWGASAPENGAAVPSGPPPPIEEEEKIMEAENEQNRHAYSVALATAAAAEAAVAAAQAAAEVVRLTTAPRRTKEEMAAIKIQTAFRGYLARRALKALRGLVRLKSLVGGQSVKRQASTTLRYMQMLARMQSEIRSRRTRISEDSTGIQRQMLLKREKELEKLRVSIGENWDDSHQSKEQIEANLQNRKEAAVRRERALAYAYSHQQTWRNSPNSTNKTFMDPNNPRWGWSWLEQWMMAARPHENESANDKEVNGDHISMKSSASRSLQSPTAKKQSRPPSRQSPSTPKSKVASGKFRPPSPRGTNGTDDDSKSARSVQSDRCRRHSIAGSSVRDDESLASSTTVTNGYMAMTVSARAKARTASPRGGERLGTPEKSSGGSAKKRLSFSGSPARPRRHSGPAKIDISPMKDVTGES